MKDIVVHNKGRRPLACYHEAGHVVARWYFGFRTDLVIVREIEEVRKSKDRVSPTGEYVSWEGFVGGPVICEYPFDPNRFLCKGPAEQNRLRLVARDMDLISILAGCYAQGVYQKKSIVSVMFGGADRDMRDFKCLIEAWPLSSEERGDVERQAEARTSALVRSRKGAIAIKSVAEALMTKGELHNQEITDHCEQVYGSECEYGAWNSCWPPTLQQIREGYIPS